MVRPGRQIIPEVQGLRAIAVVSVLIYHVWPDLVPGGYVGVDVFFVISGYLITGSLLKEFDATGSVSISGFYARRIRRLLPAASLVSIAVALTIPLFPQAQWFDIASSILASALYVQNWLLAVQAVDYLADDAKGPMNHFWSLSVEEQYYIVWPLVLLPILELARKARLRPRMVFGWFVGIIAVGSLVYSIYLTPRDPGTAYFATTTRAWELALGGLLAVFQGKYIVADRLRALLGLAGVCSIAAACFGFGDATQFPGYAALLPALGSVAVILSSGATLPWSGSTILSSRAFQYVGDISYSLYLWHWPIIIIYGELTGREIGLLDGALIFLVSCAIASLSKVFVEDRFRTADFSVYRTMAFGIACIAAVTVAGGATYLALDAEEQRTAGAPDAVRGAVAMTDPRYDWRSEDLSRVVPRPEKARNDLPLAYESKCHQTLHGTEVLTCDIGNPKSDLKIVLIGDSHATHWFPTFEEIARRRSIYFQGIAKSSCLFSLEPIQNTTLKRSYTECAEWSKNVITWLSREKPDIVLVSQSPAYSPTSQKGMGDAWTRLVEMGFDLRVIRATPWMPVEPSKCLVKSQNWVEDCVPGRSSAFRPDPALVAVEKLRIGTLDFAKYFCDAQHCPVVIGGVLVYRDAHHISATFARTLSYAMEEQLSLRAAGRASLTTE
jgi:peptidoglycan/LPS O-acetylase OafA/YrhL